MKNLLSRRRMRIADATEIGGQAGGLRSGGGLKKPAGMGRNSPGAARGRITIEIKIRTGRITNGKGTKTDNRMRKGRNASRPPGARLREKDLVVRFMMASLC
jgi:hypothetical protein